MTASTDHELLRLISSLLIGLAAILLSLRMLMALWEKR